jgi:hypothetical protein
LIGNDENAIQGHFYDATISKMATNKIDKLLMVFNFNEFSLKSENIEILPILSAAILKMASIRSRFFFGQNILPTLLNIYARFCGNFLFFFSL